MTLDLYPKDPADIDRRHPEEHRHSPAERFVGPLNAASPRYEEMEFLQYIQQLLCCIPSLWDALSPWDALSLEDDPSPQDESGEKRA